MLSDIYFIDFEASSLGWESYPIEIAWGSDLINIKSYLISPESVDGWIDWSMDSQKIHKLERQYILDNGFSPEFVCNQIMEHLVGKTVFSDNPDWDCMWMYKLFNACNRHIPNIDVHHVDSLLIDIVCPHAAARVEGMFEILKAKAAARKIVNERHRATADVKYLIELYGLANDITIGLKGHS